MKAAEIGFMIYGLKPDGTYGGTEFQTADSDSLAISVPAREHYGRISLNAVRIKSNLVAFCMIIATDVHV